MKEARIDANLRPTRVAVLVGDARRAGALAAELAIAADLEAVSLFDAPDIVVTDAADGLADDGAAIVFLRKRDGAIPARPVRALLPEGLETGRIVDAMRLVAAGLTIVPDAASDEGEGPVADAVPPRLTAREGEVLQLLASGASNKEIARRLGISVHTVKFHMASLLAKLGATSRLEAVGIGLRTGLVMV